MTIYEQLVAAGVPIDNHESDLYAKVTLESEKIVRESRLLNVRKFINQIDGTVWYDIPFAYDPFWEKRRIA